MFEAIVVGAGFSGCTAAHLLAKAGMNVRIIEKKKHIGGQCYDYLSKDGITIQTYGPHIFHTNRSGVWDFVNKFSEFNTYSHKVLSYVEGKLLEFPINRNTIEAIFDVHLEAEDVREFLTMQIKKSHFHKPPENFEDAFKMQLGDKLYDLFIKNYTKKQWGREPKDLSVELAGRIPVRTNIENRYFIDLFQGLPIGGYVKLMENMINLPNISLQLESDYFKIKDTLSPDLTVYTGELDRYFNYEFGNLEYRSVRFEFETLNIEDYQPAGVVNYPNDYDYTRITEFKKMTFEKSPVTTICKEYPLSSGEPYYTVPDRENNRKRIEYQIFVEELESNGKHLFLGRLAEYKYYNMDDAILRTVTRINEWLNRK